MPQYLSNDPNAVDSKQGGGDKYLSTDPNGVDSKSAPESSNHPYLAAITRLLGGVGSAILSPADVTGIGTAAPAAVSGASEAAAEWLEGSKLSPARIATEAAIGAVPFAKLVKSGRMVANMGKAAVLGGVGEGAREKAKGEDLSPWQIGGSAALNAATYGLFHKFLGGGGGGGPKGPSGPKMDVPPVIEQQPGNKVFRLPPDWEGKVSGSKPTPSVPPPSTMGQHNFANDVRTGVGKAVGKAPNAADALDDLDSGIQDATKIASQRRASNFRTEVQLGNKENAADLADIKRLLAIKEDGGVLPADAPDAHVPNGAGKKPPLEDSLYVNPQKDAPWGGAVIPNLDQYLTSTAQKAIDEGNAASVGGLPVLGTPSVHVPSVEPSPVEALKKVLSPRPSRSVKTVEGFQSALDKRIKAGGLPGDTPVVPQDAPGTISGEAAIPAPSPDANVAPEPVVPPSAPSAPESPLLKILKTRQGATGANYRAAKDAVKRGEIPSADYARDSHLVELGKTPEGPFAGPPAPRTPTDLMQQLLDAQGTPRTAPVEGGMVEPQPTGNPDIGAAASPEAPDWVRKANEELDAMRKGPDTAGTGADPSGETKMHGGLGIIPDKETLRKHPALLRLLTGMTGAAVGAPVGSYLDPEDPNAGVKGALAGGILGYAGSGGPQELINWRNAGLLGTPSAQMKKPLSDLGAYISKAAESAVSGKLQSESLPMMREMFNPKNVSNYVKAFKDPKLAEDVIGDAARPSLEPTRGALGWVARPFAAAQYATSQAMQRAGITPEEARDTLLLGQPKTQLAQRWLDLQKLPGWQGQAVRAIRPFARIGTNIFERGFQRIPGISMMTGDPETRVARTILGTGAMAAGALTGAGDTSDEEQGGEPTSPIVRGLRRALLASYGVPFVAGESLTGPRGIRDLIYMTPGATQTLPPPAPKDTLFTYGKKFGKRWLDQMMPDWANPEETSTETQR